MPVNGTDMTVNQMIIDPIYKSFIRSGELAVTYQEISY